MADVVLEARHLHKKFRKGELYTSLRDLVPALAKRAVRGGLGKSEFWALKDVNFQVERGEAFGIVGHNGAGKSTLLKHLCGILVPTSGELIVKGRLSALIEVGAGFHPDLTGRDNIYLNGTILGMTRAEIRSKFDAIVEFSELADFLDTPVKRYSSGMYARLGFAVAAHVEPDVLVVDEVLAVGDASFQAKAIDRVTELVRQEIPVVVVSHQLESITALCTHALLLDRGRVMMDGTPAQCIAAYLHGAAVVGAPTAGDGAIRIEELRLSEDVVVSGSEIRVDLACQVRDNGWAEPECIRLRVRLAATGDAVFEAGSDQLGATLPVAGTFGLSFSLQMNVAPGICAPSRMRKRSANVTV